MKISELIKSLEKSKKSLGDVNVYLDVVPEKYLYHDGRVKLLYKNKKHIKGECRFNCGIEIKPMCSQEEFKYYEDENNKDIYSMERIKKMGKIDGIYISNNFHVISLYNFEWKIDNIKTFIIELFEKIIFKRYRWKRAGKKYRKLLPETFEQGKKMCQSYLKSEDEKVGKLKPLRWYR